MKDVAEEEVMGTSLAAAEPFNDGRKTGARVTRETSVASASSFTVHDIFPADVMMPAQFFESCKKTAHIDQSVQRLMMAVLEVAIADWRGAAGSLAGRKLRLGRDADEWIFATFNEGSKSFTDGRTTRAAHRAGPGEASGSLCTAIERSNRAAPDGAERAGVVLVPGENPFSFENICTALGIDADYLRGGLRRWHAAFVDDGSTSGAHVARGSSEANESSATEGEKPRRAPVLGFAHSHANQARATHQLTPKPEGSRNRAARAGVVLP